MQALRTWLRLLRGPQVPREDAHRSVCLTLSAVWFRVFTGCVATPQPYSRAFSSRPERSRHALEEPPLASAPSPQQPPPASCLCTCLLWAFPIRGAGRPAASCRWPTPSAGAQGSCVVACVPLPSRYGRVRVQGVGRAHRARPLIIVGRLSCCHCLAVRLVDASFHFSV